MKYALSFLLGIAFYFGFFKTGAGRGGRSRLTRRKSTLKNYQNIVMKFGKIFFLALVPISTPAIAQISMGEIYHRYDYLVSRVTTTFKNSYIIVERNQADLFAALYSSDDRLIISLHYSEEKNRIYLDFSDQKASSEIIARPLPIYTTDWATHQVYIISKYLGGRSIRFLPLVWRGSFLVPNRSGRRENTEQTNDAIITVTSEFPSRIAYSETQSTDFSRVNNIPPATFDTWIMDRSSGEVIGQTKWFGGQYQTFAWKFPNDTGWASDQTIPGGLPFTPSKAWANIQAYAFSEFHTGATRDEPGCNGLHWLDNTIFRVCCDNHDKCYLNDPANPDDNCTAGSWFFLGNQGRRWYCFKCNLAVIACFLTGGGGSGGGGGGGGNGGVCFGEPGTAGWFVGCDPFAY